jgi:hypothetical protein
LIFFQNSITPTLRDYAVNPVRNGTVTGEESIAATSADSDVTVHGGIAIRPPIGGTFLSLRMNLRGWKTPPVTGEESIAATWAESYFRTGGRDMQITNVAILGGGSGGFAAAVST